MSTHAAQNERIQRLELLCEKEWRFMTILNETEAGGEEGAFERCHVSCSMSNAHFVHRCRPWVLQHKQVRVLMYRVRDSLSLRILRSI